MIAPRWHTSGLNRSAVGPIDRKASELSQAFLHFQFPLVLLPHSQSLTTAEGKPIPLSVSFPPLLVLTGDKSAKARFDRRLRETAINRTGFDVNQRPPIRKDEAVCAPVKPDTVSVRNPVKLLPTRRIKESLSVSLSQAGNDSWPDLGVTSFPRV